MREREEDRVERKTEAERNKGNEGHNERVGEIEVVRGSESERMRESGEQTEGRSEEDEEIN